MRAGILGFSAICYATYSLFLPPPSIGVTSHEDDLVEIVDSSSQLLRALRDNRLRITYFEFRRLLSGANPTASQFLIGVMEVEAGDFWVVYSRGGEVFRAPRAEQPEAEVFKRQPWLASKLLAFRLVQPPERAVPCVW